MLFYSVNRQHYNWLTKSLGWFELIISSPFNIQREFITDNLENEYNFLNLKFHGVLHVNTSMTD